MSKPEWKDAPPLAMWLGQDSDGVWYWWELKPIITGADNEPFWMPEIPSQDVKFWRAGPDSITIDWKLTLEPRP